MMNVSVDDRVSQRTMCVHEDRNHRRYVQFSFCVKVACRPNKKRKVWNQDDDCEVRRNYRWERDAAQGIDNDFV